MRRGTFAAGMLALGSGAALAHAAERMVILTLPTGYYLFGAAVVVALTALLGAAAPRLPQIRPRALMEVRSRVPVALTSWVAAILFWLLVASGFLGSRDPFGNPLTLAVWIGLWVALPMLTVVLGDIWRHLNPWTGPVRSLRRLLGLTGGVGLSRLGYWPAVLGFFGFAWFEIVSLAPADPAVLARAAGVYWCVVFVLAVVEGDDWLATGEAFTVYFGFLAKIAPFWRTGTNGRQHLMLGPPGAQILAMSPLAPSAAAFVALVLAAVTFDGLSETFWWLACIGVNPLEFPGRSAVVGINTVGLCAAWALTVATILGTIALSRRLTGQRGAFWDTAGPWMLSFLPISAGYHLAHYLVALLTTGQYALAVLNDPLGRQWALLGLPHDWVSFSFLNDPGAVLVIWNVQVALIAGAHVLAVLLALRLVDRASTVTRWVAHLPMAVLMVAYTVLGLWLLSAATGA